jgi:hypothetical protein
MSIARHHAEWLSLVPVSGPFLSLPVLMEAFNAGLEPHDPEHVRLLRQEYANWQEALESRKSDPALHRNWIKLVLSKTLELDDRVLLEGQAIPQSLQVEVPEHHEFLRPSFVLTEPGATKTRLLVQSYPRSQELSSYVVGSPWKASPDTRMAELLHATGVRLGLVTNGEHWMLVDAPKGETTGFASWYASLWLEEPITLRAFRSLLSASRFFNVPDEQSLEALLAKSASNQQEVTDQLGYQVRKAVEVLIHSLDRADQDFGRELLADVTPEKLYESALTVMMRLVFLFCAEERELIPSKPFPVYEQNYSVCTISKQLRELADQHGVELLERRYDAWVRLLAAFRAVYGGLKHSDIHIPAYGGNLFNPDRFPFLEGRKSGTSWTDTEAQPLPVNNRTVLNLLEALQLLQVKVPGGGPAEARRLSFRALDIEQIGHVYEGLLDHTAKRATEPFLGLAGASGKEPELPLAELEKQFAKGEAEFLKYLKEETGKSEAALRKLLKAELDNQEAIKFRTSCQSDDGLLKRVEPMAGLVRQDTFEYPVVIPEGSVFVTAGTDRRSSGTHYTPRSLTEPIVQYTLEPLVYIGPAEGLPKSEWKLKSAKELLALKICDMACGSGAFLVQATRYMAERLLEAWEIAKQANPDTPNITPEGLPSSGGLNESLIPDDPAERKLYAMRLIAQRCIYGVDKNPLAVEMAKLSLWLLTMAKDKPFEFLDHNIRCGDSLVGLHSIDQLKHFSLKPDPNDKVLFKGPLDEAIEEAITLRLKLEDMPCNSVEDVKRQEELLAEANEKIARLRCAADLLVSAEFWGENAKDKLQKVQYASLKSVELFEKRDLEEFQALAAEERRGQSMFHWCLEFPEVIVKRGGFDAFVGNPPFIGGTLISGRLGKTLHSFVTHSLAADSSSGGRADLCAYFFRRVKQALRTSGAFGLVATNTIAQGDTREVGLDFLLGDGVSLFRATPSKTWPGAATLEVAEVWGYCGEWRGSVELAGHIVRNISSLLDEAASEHSIPYPLLANVGLACEGSKPLGMGFVLTPEEAETLREVNPANQEVLFPFLNGMDLNSRPDQSASRWVIDFRDMPLDRESCPVGYKGKVAKDYPECFSIVKDKVYPERTRRKDNGDFVLRKPLPDRWWQHAEKRSSLYDRIRELKRVLIRSRVSNINSLAFVPAGWVYSEATVVFARGDAAIFAVLQSCFHTEWIYQFASSMRTDVRYTPSDCLNTFPFPERMGAIEHLGEEYHAQRGKCMLANGEGLTKTYNRFHNPKESSADIQTIRDLHAEMDNAVAAAYGWSDLKLDHGFHKVKDDIRFTISEPARREVLQRLLKLNHERYAEEVKQGLHDKKKGAAKKAASSEPELKTTNKRSTKKAAAKGPMLFDEQEDDE